MEDKRTILAVVLSIVVLVGWNTLAEHMGWIPTPPQPAPIETEAPVAPAAVQEAPVPVQDLTPSQGREIRVESPLYTAVIQSGGATLRSFSLKKYQAYLDENSPQVNMISSEAARTSPLGLTVNGRASWSSGNWQLEGEEDDVTLQAGETKTFTFVGLVDGVRLVRRITFSADTYLLREQLSLADAGGVEREVRLGFTVAASPFGSGQYDPTRLAWQTRGSIDDETDAEKLVNSGILENGAFSWGGVMSNYFLNAVAPAGMGDLVLKGRIQGEVWRLALERATLTLPAGEELTLSVGWWFGPKDRHLLAAAPGGLEGAIDFGIFAFIARPLLAVLTFFHSFVNNWGLAILLLTVCIRVFFWPLSQKSYKSMEQMKKIQPMMNKLKEKYADDKEKLRQEMMQLYKTYKINPASGCLPMLAQIPVFIGLYQALLNAIELRHAAFINHLPFTDHVWLADLSAADPFYITPLLMGGTMLAQQLITPAAGDPTQQKIMLLMPVVFTFMFLNFPSGLVLYWLCNNVLSFAQQWWMLRKSSPSRA